jgi:RND family efflux transporter MFP subunit
MLGAAAMTGVEVEQAELRLREEELGLRKARRDLELTRVVAPFAGVVTARYARAPRLVAAGDTLVRVTELAPLLARVRIPEGSAELVQVGNAVTVTTGAGVAAPARVTRLAPALDPASGTREAVVRVEGGPRLMPGASVQVRLGGQRRRVVAVPREAVGPDGYVLVVDGDRTTLRAVTLGEEVGGGRVEVVSGLAAGERIARAASAASAASAPGTGSR